MANEFQLFRPRLTVLDDRICPAVTVTQTGPILLIAGDNGGERVAVTALGDGQVRIAINGGEEVPAEGVERVVYSGAGGDNTFEFAPVSEYKRTPAVEVVTLTGRDDVSIAVGLVDRKTQVSVSSGGGEDDVRITYPIIDGPGELDLNVSTGAKHDRVTFFSPTSESKAKSDPQAIVRSVVDLGAGNDEFSWGEAGAGNPPEGDRSSQTLEINAGPDDDWVGLAFVARGPNNFVQVDLDRGNDVFDGSFRGIPVSGTPGAVNHPDLSVNVNSGAGNDNSVVIIGDDNEFNALTVDVGGGDGADILAAQVEMKRHPVLPDGPVQFRLDGGGGGDQLMFIIIDVPVTLELFSHRDLDLHFMEVNGGAGGDVIQLIGALCGPDTRTYEPFVRLDGGAGSDRLEYQGPVGLPEGLQPLPPLIEGGAGDDYLEGSDADERLFGGDGDDTITARGGNDQLHGGDGADTLDGGLGNDLLFGEDGDDQLGFWGSSNSGDDTLYGGDGNDNLYDMVGSNELFGGRGDDFLRTGNGFDWLDGGQGKDVLYSGGGNDVLIGGTGFDHLHGEGGSDNLIGGTLVGNDVIDDGVHDVLDGGIDWDTDYFRFGTAVPEDYRVNFTGLDEIVIL